MPKSDQDLGELTLMCGQFRARQSFKFVQPISDLIEGVIPAAHRNEGPDDLDIDSDRTLAPKDAGKHGHPMLGKDKRP